MKKLFTTVCCLLALAFACQSIRTDGGDKRPAEKTPAGEIEKLVMQLGSANAQTRAAATKRLRDMPVSRHYLRRNLNGKDLETRRRMTELISEHAQNEFRLHLATLAKEKADAPLDLVMDLLLENRHYVAEEQWRLTVEIVSAIADKIRKEKKINLPRPDSDYSKRRSMVGESITLPEFLPCRVIADRLRAEGLFAGSVAVLSERLHAETCGDSILLMNGQAAAEAKKTKERCAFGRSFIYCDTDFVGKSIGGCVVVARGRVCADQIAENIVVEHARQSTVIKLFSMERVGVSVAQHKNVLRVEKVLPNSMAARAGMTRGDVIQLEEAKDDLLSALERRVRKAYAKEMDFELSLRRDGGQKKLVFSFIQ